MGASRAQSSRSKSQIESDLDATRSRLTASVETLIDQVHPKRVKQRQVDNVKRLANAELDNAKATFFNARGDLRKDRVASIAGAVAGVVAVLLLLRRLVRRRRRA